MVRAIQKIGSKIYFIGMKVFFFSSLLFGSVGLHLKLIRPFCLFPFFFFLFLFLFLSLVGPLLGSVRMQYETKFKSYQRIKD